MPVHINFTKQIVIKTIAWENQFGIWNKSESTVMVLNMNANLNENLSKAF